MEFLLNEESSWCILPEGFTTYHVGLLEPQKDKLSSEELQTMSKLLDKAQKIMKATEK